MGWWINRGVCKCNSCDFLFSIIYYISSYYGIDVKVALLNNVAMAKWCKMPDQGFFFFRLIKVWREMPSKWAAKLLLPWHRSSASEMSTSFISCRLGSCFGKENSPEVLGCKAGSLMVERPVFSWNIFRESVPEVFRL